jgi:hypothetical protein
MFLNVGADPNSEALSGNTALLYAYDYWLHMPRAADGLKRLVALKVAKDMIQLLLNVGAPGARGCAGCHVPVCRVPVCLCARVPCVCAEGVHAYLRLLRWEGVRRHLVAASDHEGRGRC